LKDAGDLHLIVVERCRVCLSCSCVGYLFLQKQMSSSSNRFQLLLMELYIKSIYEICYGCACLKVKTITNLWQIVINWCMWLSLCWYEN